MKPNNKLKHQKMSGNYDISAIPLPTLMTPPPKKKRLKTKRVLPSKLLCKNWLII